MGLKMLYKQIKSIPKKIIIKKLDDFFKEDEILEDETSNIFIDPKTQTVVDFVSEFEGVFCGAEIIKNAFTEKCKVTNFIGDGFKVKPTMKLARVEGPAFEILRKERVVLNLVQKMSGVSTETSKYISKAYRKNIKILDTRKTTPGIRIFEKYAVKCGGGTNHRMSLKKGIMIKDNHIGANESVSAILKKAKNKKVPIQLEIDNRKQLEEAIRFDIDAVLLDNMEPEEIKKCIQIIKEKKENIFIEVSGGITLKSVNKYLIKGVDAISVGAIIHQAQFKNIKLEHI
tara:strand:+ start:999 stop:1856 length:858 start_codon:yes stop_codon:yes gene_type:complete